MLRMTKKICLNTEVFNHVLQYEVWRRLCNRILVFTAYEFLIEAYVTCCTIKLSKLVHNSKSPCLVLLVKEYNTFPMVTYLSNTPSLLMNEWLVLAFSSAKGTVLEM